jgi:hypothetical protein
MMNKFLLNWRSQVRGKFKAESLGSECSVDGPISKPTAAVFSRSIDGDFIPYLFLDSDSTYPTIAELFEIPESAFTWLSVNCIARVTDGKSTTIYSWGEIVTLQVQLKPRRFDRELLSLRVGPDAFFGNDIQLSLEIPGHIYKEASASLKQLEDLGKSGLSDA